MLARRLLRKKLVIDFPKKWQEQVRTIQRLFQGLKQQPEITLNGRTLTIAETPILTEPMEQYQMAGTKGYVLVLPDEAASQLVGRKIRPGNETGRWRIPGIEKRLEAIPEQWEMAAGIAGRSTAPGKSNDGCYSKGVGRCQFADWIYSHFVLRIVFKHYFYHSILLGSCI